MRQAIADAIARARPELEPLAVEHLGVFGSEARGEASFDSDVDVLVHLRQPIRASSRRESRAA